MLSLSQEQTLDDLILKIQKQNYLLQNGDTEELKKLHTKLYKPIDINTVPKIASQV